jgi:gentisate 1,2-dioxygenase
MNCHFSDIIKSQFYLEDKGMRDEKEAMKKRLNSMHLRRGWRHIWINLFLSPGKSVVALRLYWREAERLRKLISESARMISARFTVECCGLTPLILFYPY